MSHNYLKYFDGEEPVAVKRTEAEELQAAIAVVEDLLKQNPHIAPLVQDLVNRYKSSQ